MKFLTLVALVAGLAFGQSVGFPGPGGFASSGSCSLSFTTGLSLWVKADTGLTCTGGCTGTNVVTGWADQSGNGNNLTTSGSTLTYAAADINGLPAVKFPTVTSAAPGPSSFALTTGLTPSSVTIFAVVGSIVNTADQQSLLSGATNSFNYWVADTSGNHLQGADSTFAASLITSTAAVSTVYHQINVTAISGTSQALRQDRTADGTATNTTSFTGAAMNNIGYNKQAGVGGCASSTACKAFNGHLAELLVFSAALSGGNNTIVENYLNCRYGL